MAHRYYSLYRPISIGCYPKYKNNKPLNIVNFPKRLTVNVSFGLVAWGYIEFANPIDNGDAKKYELIKAPEMDYGRPLPKEREKWRHFKGNIYKIFFSSTHTENKKIMVNYYRVEPKPEAKEDLKIWSRPLDMFMSEVDHKKYPNATQKYRFERVK